MDEPESKPPSPSQLSKIPSWISVGFVLGALFVWNLPTPEPSTPPEPAPEAAKPDPVPAPRPGPPALSDIEVVFAVWGRFAIWEHELTEVALWDAETKGFNRCYEVLRSGDNYYFRAIDRLTRPVLTHGVKADAPLLFTETEAMREEWLRESRQENWQKIVESNPLKPALTKPTVKVEPPATSSAPTAGKP